jgi:hypothetical protein
VAQLLVVLTFQVQPVHFIKWNWSKYNNVATSKYFQFPLEENKMTLIVKKVSEEFYEATATPPHVRVAWSTTEPLSAHRLIQELAALGCHQQDIGDAMFEQDPNWIEKLKG